MTTSGQHLFTWSCDKFREFINRTESCPQGANPEAAAMRLQGGRGTSHFDEEINKIPFNFCENDTNKYSDVKESTWKVVSHACSLRTNRVWPQISKKEGKTKETHACSKSACHKNRNPWRPSQKMGSLEKCSEGGNAHVDYNST